MKGLDFSMHLLFHSIATAKREGELLFENKKLMSYFEGEDKDKENEKKMWKATIVYYYYE